MIFRSHTVGSALLIWGVLIFSPLHAEDHGAATSEPATEESSSPTATDHEPGELKILIQQEFAGASDIKKKFDELQNPEIAKGLSEKEKLQRENDFADASKMMMDRLAQLDKLDPKEGNPDFLDARDRKSMNEFVDAYLKSQKEKELKATAEALFGAASKIASAAKNAFDNLLKGPNSIDKEGKETKEPQEAKEKARDKDNVRPHEELKKEVDKLHQKALEYHDGRFVFSKEYQDDLKRMAQILKLEAEAGARKKADSEEAVDFQALVARLGELEKLVNGDLTPDRLAFKPPPPSELPESPSGSDGPSSTLLGSALGQALGTTIFGPLGGLIGSSLGSSLGSSIGSALGNNPAIPQPARPDPSSSLGSDGKPSSSGSASSNSTESHASGGTTQLETPISPSEPVGSDPKPIELTPSEPSTGTSNPSTVAGGSTPSHNGSSNGTSGGNPTVSGNQTPSVPKQSGSTGGSSASNGKLGNSANNSVGSILSGTPGNHSATKTPLPLVKNDSIIKNGGSPSISGDSEGIQPPSSEPKTNTIPSPNYIPSLSGTAKANSQTAGGNSLSAFDSNFFDGPGKTAINPGVAIPPTGSASGKNSPNGIPVPGNTKENDSALYGGSARANSISGALPDTSGRYKGESFAPLDTGTGYASSSGSFSGSSSSTTGSGSSSSNNGGSGTSAVSGSSDSSAPSKNRANSASYTIDSNGEIFEDLSTDDSALNASRSRALAAAPTQDKLKGFVFTPKGLEKLRAAAKATKADQIRMDENATPSDAAISSFESEGTAGNGSSTTETPGSEFGTTEIERQIFETAAMAVANTRIVPSAEGKSTLEPTETSRFFKFIMTQPKLSKKQILKDSYAPRTSLKDQLKLAGMVPN